MKISCLMVTQASRWEHFQRACRHFVQQTWSDKELVVAAYGTPEYLARLAEEVRQLPASTRTTLTSAPISLGELRNAAVGAATGEVICQWDDDDQYHPARIELQVQALREQSADICLLADYWHYFADRGELFWVDCQTDAYGKRWARPHLQGLPGSLLARRAAMVPYTAVKEGEDALLLTYAAIKRRRFALLAGCGWCYLYVFHGANTWRRSHHEDHVRRRGRILGASEVQQLLRANSAPTPPLPGILSHYDLACPPDWPMAA